MLNHALQNTFGEARSDTRSALGNVRRLDSCCIGGLLKQNDNTRILGTIGISTNFAEGASVKDAPLTALSERSFSFQSQGKAHPTTDTKIGQPFSGVIAIHLHRQGVGDSRPGTSDGMSD